MVMPDTPAETVVQGVDKRGVARVTIARPKARNALDAATIDSLHAAFSSVARDPDVRVLVVAGQGTAFCAGADLNWMRESATMSVDDNVRDASQFASMLEALAAVPCPTIGAIQGAAYGGGVGIVAAVDVAVAGVSARFALSEVRLGLEPAMIAPYVVGVLGAREFRYRALRGAAFDANEALRLGLVSEVVRDSDLEATVETVVDDLLRGGPVAQSEIKKLVALADGRRRDGDLRSELARRIAARRASPEGQEGSTAFLERRDPSWTA